MPLLAPDDRTRRARAVAAAFTERYAAPPTVVGIAPGRVNLIGEHTDYNHGLVLPVALPHATWAAARSTGGERVRISSAQQDRAWSGSLDDCGRAEGWAAYAAGVVWALREDGLDVTGLDLHVDSTVPVGAGLASSAALGCAVAAAVVGLAGLDLDHDHHAPHHALRDRLVAAGIRAETEVAGAPTGGMDQTVSVFARAGHALLIDFHDHAPALRAVSLDLDGSGLALLVTDTRVRHALVDGGYRARREECAAAAREVGVASLRQADPLAVGSLADPVLRRRARHVVGENARVTAAVEAVGHGDWQRLGRLMSDSHDSLRDDFEVSCAELDLAVGAAVAAGALGARMTGGGFGGSCVALVGRDALEGVAAGIDTAYAAAGLRAPAHLDAVPGAGVELRRSDL